MLERRIDGVGQHEVGDVRSRDAGTGMQDVQAGPVAAGPRPVRHERRPDGPLEPGSVKLVEFGLLGGHDVRGDEADDPGIEAIDDRLAVTGCVHGCPGEVDDPTNTLVAHGGDHGTHYGDADVVQLEWSKIGISIARGYYERAPGNDRLSVDPTLPVPLTFEDFLAGTDAPMDTISLIRD